MRPRVTILGAGFAGLACANELDSKRFQVTVVDRKAHFEFIPNIHELVSGVKKPAQLRLPLKASLASIGHGFKRADVRSVNGHTRAVELATGRELNADFLIVTTGAEDADFGVSGVDNHALRMRSVADGQAVHQRVAALTAHEARRSVVVVGAGLAGVEVVGELLRAFGDSALRIQLLEAQSRLLPTLAKPIGDYVKEQLTAAGVRSLTGDAVARLTAKTVFLDSGQRLRSDLTIWTGGPRPADFFAASRIADSGAWAPVDAYLEHCDYENVFVAGDSAALTPTIGKQAYHALDMGQCVAANIHARTRGRRLRRYRPAEKPTLLALGDRDTILIAGKRAVAGPALATGKELVFATAMAQLDKRPGRDRAMAVIDRGRQAQRALLWPALTDWKNLQQQAVLRRVT